MTGMKTSIDTEALRRLGAVIRERRLAVGLSQQQLAKRAGCRLSSVGRVERGEQDARLDLLIALARGFKCKLSDMIKGAD